MDGSQTEMDAQTSLYRHFDASGRLLYVGISLRAINRLAKHMAGSDWQHLIATVKVETHRTRKAALEAEALAILGERWQALWCFHHFLPHPASIRATRSAPVIATASSGVSASAAA